MTGKIINIEDGKVTIRIDNGQSIMIPISDVTYNNPRIGDRVSLRQNGNQWTVFKSDSPDPIRRKSSSGRKVLPAIIGVLAVAIVLIAGISIGKSSQNNTSNTVSSKQETEKSVSSTSSAAKTVSSKASSVAESVSTSESTAGAQSSTETSQEKEENTVNIEIYSSFNVKNYVQQQLLSSKSNNFKISTNADGYNEKTGELDTSVSGAKIFTISFEGDKDITLRVNISNTVNITPENPNPIMYQDDKLKITASHFTTDNTGLDMYHFFFNVTNNTGNDINLFVTSFSINDKSYDSIWGSMPNHQGKSVADLGAGSPSEVHQWGLDNFDKIKFTLQIDGYTGHDMLTVNGTVSHDMFQ